MRAKPAKGTAISLSYYHVCIYVVIGHVHIRDHGELACQSPYHSQLLLQRLSGLSGLPGAPCSKCFLRGWFHLCRQSIW